MFIDLCQNPTSKNEHIRVHMMCTRSKYRSHIHNIEHGMLTILSVCQSLTIFLAILCYYYMVCFAVNCHHAHCCLYCLKLKMKNCSLRPSLWQPSTTRRYLWNTSDCMELYNKLDIDICTPSCLLQFFQHTDNIISTITHAIIILNHHTWLE